MPDSDCRKREADEKSELLRTTEEEMLAELGNRFVEKLPISQIEIRTRRPIRTDHPLTRSAVQSASSARQ
jgi:hypothetical protein